MRCLFVLAALKCGLTLCLATSHAGQSSIKMVDTSIGVRLLDLNGQPLSLPNGAHLVISCFGRTMWPQQYWAHVIGQPDSEGNMLCVTKFPVDSLFLSELLRRVGNREEVELQTEVQLLDSRGAPVRLSNGIRIEIYRLGIQSWPPGRVAVIIGQPDVRGRLKTKIRLPIDSITLRNFTLLARGQGK